jgi:hypothetical protein
MPKNKISKKQLQKGSQIKKKIAIKRMRVKIKIKNKLKGKNNPFIGGLN